MAISDFTHRFTAMGCPNEIRLQAPVAGAEGELSRLATQLVAEVARLEARYSRYRPDSLLATINRAAHRGEAVRVDGETASLLDYAAACHTQSEGCFDISAGLYNAVWRFGQGDQANAPDRATLETQLAALRPRVGWSRVRWRTPGDPADQIGFNVPGMALDLGGIVKEYAADRLATLALAAGVAHGYVNLGGDLRLIGPRADGAPWAIGLRHPRQGGALLATLNLFSGAVASSGDYERCRIVEGVRYSHLLDPRSGWPVQGLAGVTVVAPLCVLAGSAATIAMVKGEAGPAWLADLGLAHHWMDDQGREGGGLVPQP